MGSPGPSPDVTLGDALGVFLELDEPSTPLTATEVAAELNCTRRTAHRKLEDLTERGDLKTKKPGAHSRVWWRPEGARGEDRRDGTSRTELEEFGDFVREVRDYAIFTLQPDGTISSWNEGARRIKGYEENEIVGEHFSRFYAEEDIEAGVPERNITTAAAEGRVEDEGWRVRADGTQFWANVVITANRDDDGTLRGFTKVTRDMTERREYERRLQRERNRTEELLETAPIPIAVQDEHGDTVMANKRAQEVLGLSEREIIEGPEDADEWTILDESGEEIDPEDLPSSRVLATGEPVSDVELAIENPRGERTWLSINASLFTRPEGETERVVLAGEDITELKRRQRELERHTSDLESELSEILGRVSDAFYAFDEEWRFTHVNDRAAEIMQLPEEELIGRNVWDVFPEARDDVYWEKLHEAMETQEPVSFEDYDEDFGVWLEFTAYPSDSGISVYFQDVTERNERERELERYRTVVETVPDGVYTVDEDGQFTMVNEAYAAMTGYDRSELIGEHVTLLVDEATAETARERENRLANGVDDGEPLQAELTTADGERFPAEATFGMFPREDGDYERVGVVRDVTERVKRERALAESERRYRTLVDNFPDGAVGLFDEELRYTAVGGELFEATVEADADDRIGQRIDEVFSPELVEVVEPKLQAALDGETVTFEVEARGLHLRAQALPVGDADEEVFGVMLVVQDVTERRERESELERLERIVENVPVGVYRNTPGPDGEFVEVNPATAEIFGADSTKEFMKHNVSELYTDPAQRAEFSRRLEEEGAVKNVELEQETLDGETIWISISAIRTEEDGEVYFDGIVQDVTERREYQRMLEESERRYRTLVDNVQHGAVALVDEDLRYQTVGGDLIDRDAEGPNELEGQPIREAITSDLADAFEPRYRAALEGESSSFEFEHEGRISSVEIFPVRDEDGEVFAAMGISQDITDRVERERELERALDLLEKAERIAEVGGWEIDVDTMDVYWSDHLFDILGVEREEEPPLEDAIDLYHEEDRPMVAGAIEDALENAGSLDVKARIYTGRGELRWLHLQGDTETDGDEVVSLRGAAQDITEQIERERALESRASAQQSIADIGQFALETDDLDAVMHQAARHVADVLDNDYCKVLDLDHDSRELTLRQGVGWHDGIVGTATVGADEDDSQAGYTLMSEEPIVVEDLATETRFSGSELLTSHDVVSGISTIIGSYEEPWGILGTHDTERKTFTEEDVTFVQSVANVLAEAIERHRYQERLEELIDSLEESNERLERFAYVASHDLQEPLRMVSNYLQLLERRYRDDLDEDAREFIDYAVDGAERMRDMISDLLAYSRLDTEADAIERVDANDVLDDVLNDLQLRIDETDADVTVSDLPTIEADRNQIEMLFQNLLSNAIKYSGEAPPKIDVGARRQGSEWVFSVEDEGIGIDPDHVDEVFDVFKRLHTNEEFPGTGIGLAMCKKIAERHGGDIWVESTPGEGSTFFISIPVGGVVSNDVHKPEVSSPLDVEVDHD